MNHAKDVDHKRGDGLIRLDILGEKLDEMDLEITQYVHDNVKEIIRVVIDYLEDNNDFTIWDVIPKNTNSISGEDWLRMIYELYNIVSSPVLRDYIKPKYQYLLYLILSWWQDVRRHIVGGANCTLISAKTPFRLCRTGTCRRLSAE